MAPTPAMWPDITALFLSSCQTLSVTVDLDVTLDRAPASRTMSQQTWPRVDVVFERRQVQRGRLVGVLLCRADNQHRKLCALYDALGHAAQRPQGYAGPSVSRH